MSQIKTSEHHEQLALFQWAAYMEIKYPALKNMYAIPNGGKRDKVVAIKLKQEGVKPGVPDINLDWPSRGYNGLRIEMKVGRKKPTPLQEEWIERLKKAGYMVLVCYSADEAIKSILEYLK